MYAVKIKEQIVRTYPHRLQAVVWCYLNGLVSRIGKWGNCLQSNVKIEEIKEGN
jgi:hypothetical protein